ncbi:MAG: GNAT family N-acetyltransferase [Candidatus Pacebacteria bacterium]|jgi:predicted acetyltransferase|nr:GNAT family N-acetyltransferase [Candidatus Paceibacterota bacterium]
MRPTKKYESQWRKAVAEFRSDSKSIKVWESLGDPDDIDVVARNAKLHSQGKNLPKGWVPYDLYWLMDGEELVGLVSLRHRLCADLMERGGHIGAEIVPSKRGKGYGSKLPGLLAPKFKALGIKRILVTSFDDNALSYRIIEKNGARLKDKVTAKGENKLSRRYWITTSKWKKPKAKK